MFAEFCPDRHSRSPGNAYNSTTDYRWRNGSNCACEFVCTYLLLNSARALRTMGVRSRCYVYLHVSAMQWDVRNNVPPLPSPPSDPR